MHERVVLLTGATSGIGRETARGLARTGATLVLACRNLTKAQALCTELQQASGNPWISVMALDLASLRAVRQFVEAFLTSHPQLHVLINNAGTFCLQRQETEDGLERTMATNYFGPFLLTAGLIPVLVQSPGARIVNLKRRPRAVAKPARDQALQRKLWRVSEQLTGARWPVQVA